MHMARCVGSLRRGHRPAARRAIGNGGCEIDSLSSAYCATQCAAPQGSAEKTAGTGPPSPIQSFNGRRETTTAQSMDLGSPGGEARDKRGEFIAFCWKVAWLMTLPSLRCICTLEA